MLLLLLLLPLLSQSAVQAVAQLQPMSKVLEDLAWSGPKGRRSAGGGGGTATEEVQNIFRCRVTERARIVMLVVNEVLVTPQDRRVAGAKLGYCVSVCPV